MKMIVTASFFAVMALPTLTFGQNSSGHDGPNFFSQNPTSSQANAFGGYDYHGPGQEFPARAPEQFFRRLRLLRTQRPLPAAREQPEKFFRRLRLLRAQRPLPAARQQPESFGGYYYYGPNDLSRRLGAAEKICLGASTTLARMVRRNSEANATPSAAATIPGWMARQRS